MVEGKWMRVREQLRRWSRRNGRDGMQQRHRKRCSGSFVCSACVCKAEKGSGPADGNRRARWRSIEWLRQSSSSFHLCCRSAPRPPPSGHRVALRRAGRLTWSIAFHHQTHSLTCRTSTSLSTWPHRHASSAADNERSTRRLRERALFEADNAFDSAHTCFIKRYYPDP